MAPTALVRSKIKAARKRGAIWVDLLDFARLLLSADGRARMWTRIVHRREVHQTTAQTAEDRYPELFDLAARLVPDAERILSFGCSTGEELIALRRRFPSVEIVGAEINPRSRSLAKRRVADDARSTVIAPKALCGHFDVIFALAVLQREPHKIAEMEVDDLSPYYPFERFDAGVRKLVGLLRDGGLLCVSNAQYRIEDSSAAGALEPVAGSPMMEPDIFGPDGRRLRVPSAHTIFRKVRSSTRVCGTGVRSAAGRSVR